MSSANSVGGEIDLAICFSMIKTKGKSLEKKQEPGDSIEAKGHGKSKVVTEGMPIIEGTVSKYEISIDQKTGLAYRNINGREMELDKSVTGKLREKGLRIDSNQEKDRE